jgi:hypothetical protein
MPFEFPAHPNTDRKDPFHDEFGRNPFGDDGVPGAASDNPYGVPAESGGGLSYHPDDYQTTLGHRGRTVFGLGSLGLVCSALGTAGMVACLAAPQSASRLLLGLTAILVLLGVPAAWTAWMMGRQDLQAMRAGAMDPAGLPTTRRGHRLGLMGTLLSAVPIVFLVVQIARTIADEL